MSDIRKGYEQLKTWAKYTFYAALLAVVLSACGTDWDWNKQPEKIKNDPNKELVIRPEDLQQIDASVSTDHFPQPFDGDSELIFCQSTGRHYLAKKFTNGRTLIMVWNYEDERTQEWVTYKNSFFVNNGFEIDADESLVLFDSFWDEIGIDASYQNEGKFICVKGKDGKYALINSSGETDFDRFEEIQQASGFPDFMYEISDSTSNSAWLISYWTDSKTLIGFNEQFSEITKIWDQEEQPYYAKCTSGNAWISSLKKIDLRKRPAVETIWSWDYVDAIEVNSWFRNYGWVEWLKLLKKDWTFDFYNLDGELTTWIKYFTGLDATYVDVERDFILSLYEHQWNLYDIQVKLAQWKRSILETWKETPTDKPTEIWSTIRLESIFHDWSWEMWYDLCEVDGKYYQLNFHHNADYDIEWVYLTPVTEEYFYEDFHSIQDSTARNILRWVTWKIAYTQQQVVKAEVEYDLFPLSKFTFEWRTTDTLSHSYVIQWAAWDYVQNGKEVKDVLTDQYVSRSTKGTYTYLSTEVSSDTLFTDYSFDFHMKDWDEEFPLTDGVQCPKWAIIVVKTTFTWLDEYLSWTPDTPFIPDDGWTSLDSLDTNPIITISEIDHSYLADSLYSDKFVYEDSDSTSYTYTYKVTWWTDKITQKWAKVKSILRQRMNKQEQEEFWWDTWFKKSFTLNGKSLDDDTDCPPWSEVKVTVWLPDGMNVTWRPKASTFIPMWMEIPSTRIDFDTLKSNLYPSDFIFLDSHGKSTFTFEYTIHGWDSWAPQPINKVVRILTSKMDWAEKAFLKHGTPLTKVFEVETSWIWGDEKPQFVKPWDRVLVTVNMPDHVDITNVPRWQRHSNPYEDEWF